ncbi:MAG TPA: hypothetical protein VFJ77_11165 [Gaiellaceae bacterium]|nr:hypothetical protein [Gaiellaceae bacterium]
MRATLVVALLTLTLGVAAAAPAAHRAPAGSCPKAWAAGWTKLANRVHAPVYCPTWMPNPLDAKIGGQFEDIYSIAKDRSYLVSFLEHGDLGSGDVHVNFRGFPGSTRIPRCPKPVGKGTITCFQEPFTHVTENGIHATGYQVNWGADQWHILLAWHYRGSLYTVSEHVIDPYDSSTRVLKNLKRLLNGLVLVRPQG